MRVVATKAFRTYHNHLGVHLAEGDEATGALAQSLLARGAPVRVVDEPADESAPEAPEPAPARRRTRPAKPRD